MADVVRSRRGRLLHRAIWATSAILTAVVLGVIWVEPSEAQEGCSVAADPSWTKPEAQAWQHLCVGKWADFNREGETSDSDQPHWNARHRVSSAFVEQLLTEPYAPVIDRHGIRLRGAWIRGDLDISEAATNFSIRCEACLVKALVADHAVIGGSLDLTGSIVAGHVSLVSTNVAGDLIAIGSQVRGILLADGMAVDRDAFLRDGSTFTDLRLRGAQIGGTLDVSGGSEVSGSLDAERLTAGNVSLRDRSMFRDVQLVGADISGRVSVSDGSEVSGVLNGEGTAVGESLFLRNGAAFNDISLTGAIVAGDLDVTGGSEVSGELMADRIDVDGGVFLRDGSTFADVRLRGARIGGDLDVLYGSEVSGSLEADGLTAANVLLRDRSTFRDVRLVGADISGQFSVSDGSGVLGTLGADGVAVGRDVFLRHGSTFSVVRLVGAEIGGLVDLNGAAWTGEASLVMQDAHAGGFLGDTDAAALPAKVALDGFTFDRWVDPDPRTLGSHWYLNEWLARLDTFSPGPYNQLAAVMDAQGHPVIAADLRYGRSHAERLQVPWSQPERWRRELYRLVLGYGYRPWRALGWHAVLWFIGFVVLQIRLQPDPCRLARRNWAVTASEWTPSQAAWFSLDRLLPAAKIADLGEYPTPDPKQAAWLRVQQLCGWVLTLFIVGWLGGLLVQA